MVVVLLFIGGTCFFPTSLLGDKNARVTDLTEGNYCVCVVLHSGIRTRLSPPQHAEGIHHLGSSFVVFRLSLVSHVQGAFTYAVVCTLVCWGKLCDKVGVYLERGLILSATAGGSPQSSFCPLVSLVLHEDASPYLARLRVRWECPDSRDTSFSPSLWSMCTILFR